MRSSALVSRLAVAVALLVPAGAAAAAAKKKPVKKPPAVADADRVHAKELYLEAERHYMLAEYDAAIEKYKEAYRFLPDPIFLFDVGQAYRKSGRPEDAIAFYKNYLIAAPTAANRAEVERFVADLKASVAAAAAAAEAAAAAAAAKPPDPDPASAPATDALAAPAAPAPRPPRRPGTAVWVAVVAGALVVAGGAAAVWYFALRPEPPWVADFRP